MSVRLTYRDGFRNHPTLEYAKDGVIQVSEIIEKSDYYPFGLKQKGNDLPDYSAVNKYKYGYGGKELNDELGLDLYDFGARNYDPALARWLNVDPLAENSRRWTPYNYAYNNPIFFVDPDGMQAKKFEELGGEQLKSVVDINEATLSTGGMESDGDYYTKAGQWLGSDGKNDNKAYVVKEGAYKANETGTGYTIQNSGTKELSIGQIELERLSGNVYNETFEMPESDKMDVASAMQNRLEDYKGNVIKMTDKLMFNSDNHNKKINEIERTSGNKTDYPPRDRNNFTYQDVSTKNYRAFFNNSKMDRNNNSEMTKSTKAVIQQDINKTDRVNGAKNWRGDGKKHRFF